MQSKRTDTGTSVYLHIYSGQAKGASDPPQDVRFQIKFIFTPHISKNGIRGAYNNK